VNVPFFNYRDRFAADGRVIAQIVAEVGASDNFILKNRVSEFEGLIREYTGALHAVAVASGTAALTISLASMGIGPDAEVLTPAFSFISSASAIVHLGARPVFVDVDPDTCTLRPEEIEARITPNTRAIIPVHLFSVLADMTAIVPIARRYNLRVLEDSAVSLGARLGDMPAGLLGDVGAFSFFPAKPLGGIGDGGMIVTNDAELGVRCRMLRNHGQDGTTRFLHHLLGYNHRMDEVMGAYLAHRFHSLQKSTRRRAEIAECYNTRFAALAPQVQVPPTATYDRVYYTYVIQVDRRDELRSYLSDRGIETQVYYPLPLHLQPAFAYLGYKPGDFPHAERISRRTLALPLYPEMPDAHAEAVADAVVQFYA